MGRVRRDVPSTYQIPPREAHDDLGGSRDRARGETDRVARCVRASNRDLGFGVDLSASESERGKPADSISRDSIRHPARRRVKHLNRTYLSQESDWELSNRLTPSNWSLDAPSFQFARWLVAAVCSASFATGRGRGADVSRALSSGRPIACSPRRPRRSAGAAGPTKGTTGAPGTTLGRRRGIGSRRSEPRDGRSGLSSGGGAACRSGTTHRTV